LVRAALEYGWIWASTGIAYADRARGCEPPAAAVTTVFDRLVAVKIELLPEGFVALLATLDRSAACEALSQRVTDCFGHEVVVEAGQLAELDPAIARDVLIEAANRASLPKVELIRILAALDRSSLSESTLGGLLVKGCGRGAAMQVARESVESTAL
jgi:hypothetical protein